MAQKMELVFESQENIAGEEFGINPPFFSFFHNAFMSFCSMEYQNTVLFA